MSKWKYYDELPEVNSKIAYYHKRTKEIEYGTYVGDSIIRTADGDIPWDVVRIWFCVGEDIHAKGC